jgi:hypothetical protein
MLILPDFGEFLSKSSGIKCRKIQICIAFEGLGMGVLD